MSMRNIGDNAKVRDEPQGSTELLLNIPLPSQSPSLKDKEKENLPKGKGERGKLMLEGHERSCRRWRHQRRTGTESQVSAFICDNCASGKRSLKYYLLSCFIQRKNFVLLKRKKAVFSIQNALLIWRQEHVSLTQCLPSRVEGKHFFLLISKDYSWHSGGTL